jgi:hypothetical protein
VDLNITEDSIKVVAHCLSRGAGQGGTDTHMIQQRLLRFGVASCSLQQACAKLVDWLSNAFPPWAAYQGLMAGRLVALDKCPDVRPPARYWQNLAASGRQCHSPLIRL